jgi:hypothetical protein
MSNLFKVINNKTGKEVDLNNYEAYHNGIIYPVVANNGDVYRLDDCGYAHSFDYFTAVPINQIRPKKLEFNETTKNTWRVIMPHFRCFIYFNGEEYSITIYQMDINGYDIFITMKTKEEAFQYVQEFFDDYVKSLCEEVNAIQI